MKKVRCGIVGVVGRGQIYVKPMLKCKELVQITALCDLKEDEMQKYADIVGEGVRQFTNYEEMVDSGLCDLVVVATPAHLHVPQAIYALERGIHVVSEVPAGDTLESCRRLYQVAKKSKAQYMLAENCNFQKPIMITKNMIADGLIGVPHYGQSAYLHELEFCGYTTWRDFELSACYYSTHCLGPILDWFGNERITKICCIGSGIHPICDGIEGDREYSNVMLCKTESGRLVMVRNDQDSKSPYHLPWMVEGTLGRVEIDQYSPVDVNRVHLDNDEFDHTHYAEEWKTLEYFEKEYLPESWTEAVKNIRNQGHDRADYVMVLEFVKALAENRKMPIDIDMAMNMTLPGIMSKESIARDGEWISIPRLDEE